MGAIFIIVGTILYGRDFDKCGGDIYGGDFAVGRLDLHSMYPYFKWQRVFSFFHIFLSSSITDSTI